MHPRTTERGGSAARLAARALLAALLLGTGLPAQNLSRVSISTQGIAGDSQSYINSISADARCVAFQSSAANLVPGDTNGTWDVFVRDRLNGTTERVSVDSAGAEGNSFSWSPSISADGRFVAFSGSASNLVAGDTNARRDVFVRDRQTGTTERVSVSTSGQQGSGDSENPSLSADGRYVAFSSAAADLVAGDSNNAEDVFVRDLQLGTTTLASCDSAGLQSDGASWLPSISADGAALTFVSRATNLVAVDTNGCADIFVHDCWNATTERASLGPAGTQANASSQSSWISGDGQTIAFSSDASNLVPGDTNARTDIFVRNRATGSTERVSVGSGGVQGDGDCWVAAPSADGRSVAFYGYASNLVPGDTNGCADVFLRDRQHGLTRRVSVGLTGAQGDDYSWYPSITADGRHVAYASAAANLIAGDTNACDDVFVVADPPLPIAFCFGDGSTVACPCGNSGLPGRGCENSAASGGALIGATGFAWLSNDTLVLTCAGELPNALSILLQGDASIGVQHLGDGLRCTGGMIYRLFAANAAGGGVSLPQPGEPPISVRSAALGDVLGAGSTRIYQVYYRDPSTSFCPAPPGNTFNISNALSIYWAP